MTHLVASRAASADQKLDEADDEASVGDLLLRPVLERELVRRRRRRWRGRRGEQEERRKSRNLRDLAEVVLQA